MTVSNGESILQIKGIGEKSAQNYFKLGIDSVDALIHYYPKDYIAYEPVKEIASLKEGDICAVWAKTCDNFFQKKYGNRLVTTVSVFDSTMKMDLVFFQMPFLRNLLKSGSEHIFYGKVHKKGKKFVFEQPVIMKREEYEERLTSLQPVYSLCHGLTSKAIGKSVRQALNQYLSNTETLPEEIIQKYELIDYKTALWNIHFPKDYEEMMKGRKRLVFEEFYVFFCKLKQLKEQNLKQKTSYTMMDTAYTQRLIERLPYELTKAQKKAWEEIKSDLTGEYVTNRLIQGDVGSGKTILAFLSMLLCATNQNQCALMAPTEVLATQHFEDLCEMIRKFQLPFSPVLLTGSMSVKEKREAYDRIQSGEANAVIGTHALFQEKVEFSRLALVITDEQHRFGVRQREALQEKGSKVHVLVMSATPIPRTLAVVLYGDLAISTIDELPANRLPIKNCVVNTEYRQSAYHFIDREVKKGRQAYIICPMVEENEEIDIENVTDYAKTIKEYFDPSVIIATLHGQMKPTLKNKIMNDFFEHKIDILVSTTVIEVGINVPNATVMMIENAERFGLAQLHQLRGRVGRGENQSYCIFVSGNNSENTMKRLNILKTSNDGFYIANEDLKLRGPGELFGFRQSGELYFKLGDIYQDNDLLLKASQAANEFF